MGDSVKALLIVLALIIGALALTGLTMKISWQSVEETKPPTPVGGLGTVEAASTFKGESSLTNMASLTDKTLIVTGSATIFVEPNRVYLRLAVETDKPLKNATEAYTEVIIKAKRAIDELKKEEGVISIKTEYVNLNPLYDWVGGERILKGYVASYSFQVEISDLEKAGEIVSKAVSLGINRLYGLSFGLSDEKRKSVEKEAIEKAVNDAKAKAEKLAESLGIKIVGVRSVVLGAPVTAPYYSTRYSYAVPLAVVEAMPPTPIETGKGVAVSATVTVVYEISEE